MFAGNFSPFPDYPSPQPDAKAAINQQQGGVELEVHLAEQSRVAA
jgi:hypothetical protein